MEDRVRSFIAVIVPPESAAKVRAAQQELRAAEPALKWVDPDTFHITLKFLGGVEPQRLEAVWNTVQETLAVARPFAMRLQGVGAFPSPSRARVVWVGVSQGAEELTALAERVEEACLRHGFERENRPFGAHLTLGRARQPGPNRALTEAMQRLAEADLGEARVERVVLMRSELTRQGARYQQLRWKELA